MIPDKFQWPGHVSEEPKAPPETQQQEGKHRYDRCRRGESMSDLLDFTTDLHTDHVSIGVGDLTYKRKQANYADDCTYDIKHQPEERLYLLPFERVPGPWRAFLTETPEIFRLLIREM